MKIFSPEQIRAWDQFTISREPILSRDLMKRAASRATDWLLRRFGTAARYAVFCGAGNNGGDGIVMAKLLWLEGARVDCYLLDTGSSRTLDNQHHLDQFHAQGGQTEIIREETSFPVLTPDTIVIDALWGSGLNRPIEGIGASLIRHINQLVNQVIAVDQPSGLLPVTSLAVHANHTLSFQTQKLAFFYPENDPYTGIVHVLDIGLHPAFYQQTPADYETTGPEEAAALLRPRPRSGHKGSFGHAALIAGSWGMMGSAMLAAEAVLRSGVGKLSCLVTEKCYPLLQSAVREAIFSIVPGNTYPTATGAMDGFASLGLGPGWGVHEEMAGLLVQCLQSQLPIILDADALNLLSRHKDLQARIPENSILTPHPKEFDALTHAHGHTHDRVQTAMHMARQWNSVVVLKGHHTLVATPGGKGYFNTTGNNGMATAGSGDVLTGMITGLRAQGYGAEEAARLGVWLHGYAGDLASGHWGPEAMIAGDMIGQIGNAFNALREKDWKHSDYQ